MKEALHTHPLIFSIQQLRSMEKLPTMEQEKVFTIYIGAWKSFPGNLWKNNAPEAICKSIDGAYQLRILPGNYIFAAYIDLDQNGHLRKIDIDDDEPFGVFTQIHTTEG